MELAKFEAYLKQHETLDISALVRGSQRLAYPIKGCVPRQRNCWGVVAKWPAHPHRWMQQGALTCCFIILREPLIASASMRTRTGVVLYSLHPCVLCPLSNVVSSWVIWSACATMQT